ncbi:MAG: alpha/beta hydrolase [Caldithrix sp.]|nr:MAG: alpha/beta hydrolase [Caldithrix sp.]
MSKSDDEAMTGADETKKQGRKKRILRRIGYTLVPLVLVLYAFYAGFYYRVQRSILFPVDRIKMPSGVIESVLDLEQIWLETDYGKVEAWFLPPKGDLSSESVPAVIVGHGNAQVIDHWPERVRGLQHLGFGVLLVEYPGYGRSEGEPSQESITTAFVAAYDNLVGRNNIDKSRIILFGWSLGGGAVCALAAERPSTALILLSTFKSIRSFAASFYLPGFIVRDPFDNLSVVREYSRPVLVIHGRADTMMPYYEHGVTLYEAAQNGEIISYDCGHNDCVENWDSFWQNDVATFLRKNGIL